MCTYIIKLKYKYCLYLYLRLYIALLLEHSLHSLSYILKYLFIAPTPTLTITLKLKGFMVRRQDNTQLLLPAPGSSTTLLRSTSMLSFLVATAVWCVKCIDPTYTGACPLYLCISRNTVFSQYKIISSHVNVNINI